MSWVISVISQYIIPQFKKAAPIKIIFQTEIISQTVTRSVFLSGKMRLTEVKDLDLLGGDVPLAVVLQALSRHLQFILKAEAPV